MGFYGWLFSEEVEDAPVVAKKRKRIDVKSHTRRSRKGKLVHVKAHSRKAQTHNLTNAQLLARVKPIKF